MDSETYLLVRDNRVTKANTLIQRSRFNLSKVEQRAILYIISQISPEDNEFKQYEFYIPDFCRACGIEDTNGHHKQLKDALLNLRKSAIWVKDGKKLFTLGWLTYAEIVEGSGTVTVEIDQRMKPFLLQLREQFTSYALVYALAFRSKYSIRLYELLKSIEKMDVPQSYAVDTLRELMGLEPDKLKEYKAFKNRALKPAVEEINEFSDIEISYSEEKQVNKVISITFTVMQRDVVDRLRQRDKIDKKMGTGGQMTIWERIQDADRRHGGEE